MLIVSIVVYTLCQNFYVFHLTVLVKLYEILAHKIIPGINVIILLTYHNYLISI